MADRIKSFQQETNQINILKSIRTDLGATASSYTPDTSVVTKDRVVTYAQAEEELSVLGDIEEGVKQQVTDLDIAQKDIKNIKLLLQGNLYDYQTDSTSAYTKTVPNGAMPYASLDSVGGKTVVMNQLIQNGDFSADVGWTYSSSTTHSLSDGVATIVGAVDNYFAVYLATSRAFNVWAGHKYLISAVVSNDIGRVVLVPTGATTGGYETFNDVSTPTRIFWIYTPASDGSVRMHCRFHNATVGTEQTVTGTISNYMCIDLTLMFGAGNEPSTVAEFKQMFSADYFPYNAGTLLSAGVTEVVSKKADTTTIATYPIPAEIRSIEGYGWSAGSVYNYIDYERKKFVQNVARVDLGTLTWGSSTSSGKKYFFSSSISSEIKYVAGSNGVVNNIIYPYGSTGSFLNAYNGAFDCIGVGGAGANVGRIGIYDSAKEEMTNAEFKDSLNGVYAYYELATPQEIDISAYLTDDNLIEVESGGTLTFPNSNGTDYQIPVPSAETYMVDLQASL